MRFLFVCLAFGVGFSVGRFFLQLPILLFLASPVVPFCTSSVYSLEPWFFLLNTLLFIDQKKKNKDQVFKGRSTQSLKLFFKKNL